MKRIFIILASICLSLQCLKASETDTITFCGVDFSGVNVLNAKEDPQQFIDAFKGINTLMISEASKYNLDKYLSVFIDTKNIEYGIKSCDALNDRDFTDYETESLDIESIVAKYPKIDGNVLIIVAKELNKAEAKGVYDIVIFDGHSKSIISQTQMIGEAGGFGVRNFWANSIYKGLKSYYWMNRLNFRR